MKKRSRSKATQEINAASMSDIAFLLLIFFLVTTIFALEQGIPLALPGQESSKVKMNRKNLLIIKAFPNGSITVTENGSFFRSIISRMPRVLFSRRRSNTPPF